MSLNARRCLAVVFTSSVVGSVCSAGDLNPPAGPVSPTMKTLQQVEPRVPIGQGDVPFVITQPGSFYLTENLYALGPGQNCITINSSNVTLDLRGFEIAPTEVFQFNRGVVIGGTRDNVAISNGTIRQCAQQGVWAGDALSPQASGVMLADLRLIGHGAHGALLGINARIFRCYAKDCTNAGFATSNYAVIADTVGEACGGAIGTGNLCTVRNCIAANSVGRGFLLNNENSVIGCIAYNNGDDGFNVRNSSVISCIADSNVVGFSANGSVLENCRARNNAEIGYEIFSGTVRSSNAEFNDLLGFDLVDARVIQCTARRNLDVGMQVGSDCYISDSVCIDNGPLAMFIAGMEVTGSDNRIQGCDFTGNDVGLLVSGTENFIIQNTFHDNGFANYSIVAGNSVGDILNVAGATITTTNPWRNFEY